MTHMLVRFLIVFGVGVGLVWALGIGPEGSWFGEKTPKSADPVASADVNRPPAVIPTADEGIQVRELAIPVREEVEDRPGVQIIKYWLRIGESVGGIEKHMRARDVRIEIHNKEYEENDKVVANVYGKAALILFQTTPDPRANFRDAQIEQMTLSEDVVVEYLDKDTGEPVTTLRSKELVLTDERFHAPGPAVIEQEGLNFAGEDLTYDKATGIFEFQKNVRARVTQFSLPGSKDDPAIADDETAGNKTAGNKTADGTDVAVAQPVEKVITCDGHFAFTPAEPPPEDPEAVSDLENEADKQSGLSDVVGGGTLTFEDNVVATQGDSVLKNCSKLVLHVDKVASENPSEEPAPTDGSVANNEANNETEPGAEEDEEEDEGKLGIKSMEAYGKAGERAVLVDPRGELYGEVILLEPTEAGREIVLRGSPEIKNAVAGTPDENQDPALVTRMSGGARDEIRVRPLPAEASGTALADPDADAPEPVERMALELRNKNAWLSANNADPAKTFRIGGDKVDLLFQKVPGEEPGEDPGEEPPEDPSEQSSAGVANAEESAPEEEAESSFELEQLIAEGSANVLFGMGSFRGDKIVGSPKEPGADVSSFSIVVTPDPVVHLDIPKNPDKADSKDQTIDINTSDGSLTYAPPADSDAPTAVRMEGKTHVAFSEDGALVTTLDAEKSVDVEFLVGGASGIKSLTAEGSVIFHSERDGVHGSGDQLELIPTEDGKFKMDLRGSPAVVTQQNGDDPPRIIRARWIVYDPETGKLHAEDHIDRVIATLPGLSPETDGNAGSSAAPTMAAVPGALRARTLDVTPTTDSRGQDDLLVEAIGQVSFRDPEKGIDATGERLVYRESAADAVLYGTDRRPAEVIRIDQKADPNDEEKTPSTVSITGPKVLINKVSESLSCPEDGSVVLVRFDKDKKAKTRVSAHASGPVVYRNDQLELHVQVMIRFEEDTGKKRELWEEKRALWCDLATVSFAQGDKAGGETNDDASQDSLGFDSLLAQGRVHLEQVEPRPMVGEGETLEFREVDGRQAMILQGIYPRAWVEGLMTNRHLRYVADTFRFFEGTDEFEVENGEFSFIGDGQ